MIHFDTNYLIRPLVAGSPQATTGRQTSLRTRDEAEAKTLIHVRNESVRQPFNSAKLGKAMRKFFVPHRLQFSRHRGPGRDPIPN